ncbi:MAG: carboxypeptidase regulatory-like domain-containing protein [Acidobacteriota bacterium]|nr:carboxypeptidase regulatory-like domain-containing protein [Acidobacteriota bacterium]
MKLNLKRFLKASIFVLMFVVSGNLIFAQHAPQFVGDYDKTFAPPKGYFVDPQQPDPAVNTYQTTFVGGALLPDGSIIAGGRHNIFGVNIDFYLRKFTPSGAVGASFGTNGLVRANFYTGYSNSGQPSYSTETPYVVKVQPDGKILIAGQCNITSPNTGGGGQAGIPYFGEDGCVMRFNADGSVDATFGNSTVMVGGGLNGAGQQNPTYTFQVGEGRFMTQTGVIDAPGNPGPRRGTQGKFYDMWIQPDGKILLVGETRNEYPNSSSAGLGAIIVRLNPDGTRDGSFGAFGIVNMAANPLAHGCYPNAAFHGVAVQPDGRIIAVGYNEVIDTADCNNRRGKRFMVTRWTANGQAETMRHLDNNTTFNSQNEGGGAILFTKDGSKVLVSGTYKNLGSGASHLPTMVRFNSSDLSVDTSFGTNGIAQYNGCGSIFCGFTSGGRLFIKAIQPDGKIIGRDEAQYNVVRFNPNGTPDLSFGNRGVDGSFGGRGRLALVITHYNNVTNSLDTGDILVRPNGRINLVGQSYSHAGAGEIRAVVSQNFNTMLTPSGSVGWWASEGDARDLKGTNHGSLQNGATFAIGEVGQSFNFDGTDDRVLIGNPTNLQLQNFTIETWIKRSSSTVITNNPDAANPAGFLFAYGTGGYGFFIDQATNRIGLTQIGAAPVFSTTAVTDTNYHHVAVTKNGGTVTFYIDGAADTSVSYNPTFTFATNAAIGGRGDAETRNSFFGNIDELSIYNRTLTADEIAAIVSAANSGKLKTADTPAGSNVQTTIGSATLSFPNVSSAGTSFEISLDSSGLPPLPTGARSTGLFYDISTSAIFSGNVRVCFKLPINAEPFNTVGGVSSLKILHLENGFWVDRTVSADFATRIVCAQVSSFSPFAITQAGPTTASVTIGGQVKTAAGRGIRNVKLTLTNQNGETRAVLSNAFGYYRFADVPVGGTYIISAFGKRFAFETPMRVLNIAEETENIDFIALPQN